MVMATLQMMKDAQWEVLRAEARNDSKRVKKTVEQARKTGMEKLVYWYQKDFTGGAEEFGFELSAGTVSAALEDSRALSGVCRSKLWLRESIGNVVVAARLR